MADLDHAALVLVGDFETADALAKIRRYFGKIPRGTKAFTRYPVPAVRQTAEKRAVYYDPLAPLPLVGMAFRLPPPEHPDTAALEVIGQILSEGKSSRLYRSLVRDKQLAASAEGDALILQRGGIFFFFAVANAGKAPADVEKALLEEIEKLRTAPVGAGELAKAKNQ